MSAEKLLFNVIILFLIIFIFNRYLILQKTVLLIVLTGQFFALVLSVIAAVDNVKPNILLEVLTAIFGVLVPGAIFFYFYFRNREGRIKKVYKMVLDMFISNKDTETDDKIMIEDGSKDIYDLGKKVQLIPEKTADVLLRGYISAAEEIPQSVREGFSDIDKLIGLKAWRKALEKYLVIEKQCGDNPVLQFNIANLYYHLKEYQNAVNYYDRALKINTMFKNSDSVEEEETSHKAAARRIKSVLKKVEDYEIVFNRAVCLVNQGKYEKAIEEFKRAGDNKDNWINVYKPLAIIYEVLSMKLEALDMYQNLAEIYPEDFEIQRKAGDFICVTKNYEKAKEYYDRANILKPEFYQGYLNAGICLLEDKRFKEAIDMLSMVLKICPDISEVRYNLGNAYYGTGQKLLALSEYKKAIELNLNDYKSLYNLGVILDEMDMKEEAILAFEQALDIKPDFYDASNNLSVVLCSLERYDEAVKNYLKAIQYNPSNIELYFNLAIILEYQEKYIQAEELYHKILKMNPKLCEAYYNIGLLRFYNDDLKGAEHFFRKAIENNTDYHKAYYQLAKIYVRYREYGRCINCLNKAVGLSHEYIDKLKVEKVFDEIRNLKSYDGLIEISS